MTERILSIIIPVYNVETYLERCIQSCTSFLDKNVEIILIDDGSTDSSGEICDNYASEKIKVIHKKNGGLSDARNYGLKIATGKYIWFVDSDDLIYPIYDSLLEYFKLSPDIVSMNYIVSLNGKTQKMSHSFTKDKTVYTGTEYMKHVLETHSYFVPVWSYIYNKNYFISNNFEFRKGIYHEDEQITPYLLLKANKILVTDAFGYNYIIRKNSIVTNKNTTKNVNDLFSIYKENEKFFINEVQDERLQKLLLNDISEKMMYICSRYNVSSKRIKELYDMKKIRKNSLGISNNLKAILFTYFRIIYSLIFKLNEKRKSK